MTGKRTNEASGRSWELIVRHQLLVVEHRFLIASQSPAKPSLTSRPPRKLVVGMTIIIETERIFIVCHIGKRTKASVDTATKLIESVKALPKPQ